MYANDLTPLYNRGKLIRPDSTISRTQLMIQEVDKGISRDPFMPGMHAVSKPRHGPPEISEAVAAHLLHVPGSSFPYI